MCKQTLRCPKLGFGSSVGKCQTYWCDVSQHGSLKGLLDVSTVPLLLFHYVFPQKIRDYEASLQNRQFGWRVLNDGILGKIQVQQHAGSSTGQRTLTSASALKDFFASVFERVAATREQQPITCSSNKVVFISNREMGIQMKTGWLRVSCFPRMQRPVKIKSTISSVWTEWFTF